jgi:hypothetical protein
MKACHIGAVMVSVLLCLAASAQNGQPVKETGKIDPLPRDLEMQLALSALPRHLRDNATVYVLNPARGFEVARKGTNGFHAFVARIGDDTFRGSWPLRAYRDDILYPVSFDEAGAKANMRVFFDAAEMEAKWTPPEELKRIIQERYKTHYYKPPERAGVSYMMSPILRTYVNSDSNELVCTTIVPHVMHYVPNITPDAVGASTPTADDLRYFCKHGYYLNNPDPFVIFHGPHGYLIQFLGVTERSAIRKEYEGLLTRLCTIKKEWCLPK